MLRILTAARIAGAVVVLAATFLLGFWLTSPAFPVGQKFVAVSLNGEPLISTRPFVKVPTLEVWRVPVIPPPRHVQAGSLCARVIGHCNWSDGQLTLIPPNFLMWDTAYNTAVVCAEWELEARFFAALRGTNRWRIENGALILYNGRDTLRFLLAPA